MFITSGIVGTGFMWFGNIQEIILSIFDLSTGRVNYVAFNF